MSALAELVRADSIEPGDRIDLPRLGWHVVALVETHEPGELVTIVYYRRVEEAWEGRAGIGRVSSTPRLCLRSIVPRRPESRLRVQRGDRMVAHDLAARLRRQSADRERERAARWSRAKGNG